MSLFYFFDPAASETAVHELSATTDIAIKAPAVVTKSPVEDGSSLVDNYFIDNKTATFSGIITQLRVAGQAERLTLSSWIADVESLRDSKVLLTLVAHTEVIPDCLITQFNLDKNKEQGLTGWRCELEFQEVDISERARLVQIPAPKPEVKDSVSGKNKGSGSTTKEVALGTSSALDIADAVRGNNGDSN